jgi:hypothetical protein
MKIPLYQPTGERVAVPPVLPSVHVSPELAAAPGQMVERLGEMGMELAAKWKAAETQQEHARLAVQATEVIGHLDQLAADWKPDPSLPASENATGLRRGMQEQVGAWLQTIKDPQMRDQFAAHVNSHINTLSLHARQRAAEAITADTLARDMASEQDELRRAVALPDGPERDSAIASRIARGNALVATGTIHADTWEKARQHFLGEVDRQTALHRADLAPNTVLSQLDDPTMYPHLTEEQRWALRGEIHGRRNQAEQDTERERKKAQRDSLRAVGRGILVENKYRTPDGKVDEEAAMVALGPDADYEAMTHVRSLATIVNNRVDTLAGRSATGVASGFRVAMREAGVRRDWNAVNTLMRQAEQVLAQQPHHLETVSALWAQLEQHRDTLQRLDEGRLDRKQADQLRAFLALESQATAEFLSWLPRAPTKDDAMAEQFANAKEEGLALIRSAANKAQNPVAAIQQARVPILMHLYGSAQDALAARRTELDTKGIVTMHDLVGRKDTMPEVEFNRLVDLFREVAALNAFAQKEHPRAGKPTKQAAPVTPPEVTVGP